jgi:hypothetical protein
MGENEYEHSVEGGGGKGGFKKLGPFNTTKKQDKSKQVLDRKALQKSLSAPLFISAP